MGSHATSNTGAGNTTVAAAMGGGSGVLDVAAQVARYVKANFETSSSPYRFEG
jgi:hypothetical protein